MDLVLLLGLILLNAVFAMSEMALSASRKARLQVLVEAGNPGAAAAMDLHDKPTKFLSTVQIGITSIGVLNGIVGEAAFAGPLSHWLQQQFPLSAAVAGWTATGLVVVLITFATIIFGELVPTRIGQLHPEAVAVVMARPMQALSTATRPFVALLTLSTDAILRLMGQHRKAGPGMTEEEIAASLEEGLESGVIEEQEHQMVRNVFRLDERPVGSMMVPRSDVVWLDINAPMAEQLRIIGEHAHSRYPVCRDGLHDVVGVVASSAALPALARGETLDIAKLLQPAVFVPETLTGMELLEQFRLSRDELVFVVDEYGEVQGVITVRDLLEAITGEFTPPSDDNPWAVERGDGSWLLDGLIPAPELKDRLDIKELPDEERGRYNTLAGMIMLLLGRVPRTADSVQWSDWQFEVVDLDGKRIDKVLATPLKTPGETIQ
ncbi:MAG: hemolysin family protein [Betaproteobacteria bacterium]